MNKDLRLPGYGNGYVGSVVSTANFRKGDHKVSFSAFSQAEKAWYQGKCKHTGILAPFAEQYGNITYERPDLVELLEQECDRLGLDRTWPCEPEEVTYAGSSKSSAPVSRSFITAEDIRKIYRFRELYVKAEGLELWEELCGSKIPRAVRELFPDTLPEKVSKAWLQYAREDGTPFSNFEGNLKDFIKEDENLQVVRTTAQVESLVQSLNGLVELV